MLLAGLLLSGTFIPVALCRYVDADEGYYLMAARLVHQGTLPYRDFFYTQMPGLPYVYSIVFKLPGSAWFNARLLTASVSLLSGLIIYKQVRRVSGAWSAVSGVCLFAFSSWMLEWNTVVKTYALATLFALQAFSLLDHPDRSRLRVLFSGVLLSLMTMTRLLYVVLFPCAFYAILSGRWGGGKKRTGIDLLCLVAGLVVGLLPLLAFFDTWKNFWFGNVHYHALRSDLGLVSNFREKVSVLLNVLGMRCSFPMGADLRWQMAFLVFAVLVLSWMAVRRGIPTNRHLPIVASLVIVHALPTPSYTQYYECIIPFLILALCEEIPLWSSSDATRRWRGALPFILAVLFGLYMVAGGYGIYRITLSGNYVMGLWSSRYRQDWKISSVRKVSRAIDHLAGGAPVIATWPGYMVESTSMTMPGLENHFGLPVAGKLPPALRHRIRLVDMDEVCDFLARHQSVVVLGLWIDREQWERGVCLSGYRVVETLGHVRMYMRSPDVSARRQSIKESELLENGM